MTINHTQGPISVVQFHRTFFSFHVKAEKYAWKTALWCFARLTWLNLLRVAKLWKRDEEWSGMRDDYWVLVLPRKSSKENLSLSQIWIVSLGENFVSTLSRLQKCSCRERNMVKFTEVQYKQKNYLRKCNCLFDCKCFTLTVKSIFSAVINIMQQMLSSEPTVTCTDPETFF